MMIKLTRGDHATIAGKITDAATGAAYDLTGCTLWCTAKKHIGDEDGAAVFRKLTGAGITVPTPANGMFTVDIEPADTASLPSREVNTLFYDLQLRTATGKVQTISKGQLHVEYDVTQSI